MSDTMASAGVWLRAMKTEVSAVQWVPVAREGLKLLAFSAFYSSTGNNLYASINHSVHIFFFHLFI